MYTIDYEGDKVLREIVDAVNAYINSFTDDKERWYTWEDEKDESFVMCDVREQGNYGIIALSIGIGDEGGNGIVVAILDHWGDGTWEIESITYTFDGIIGIIKGNTGTKGV